MKFPCCDLRRLDVLRAGAPGVNAIEFVEVLDRAAPPGVPRQRTLLVRLLRAGFALGPDNVRISGGERIRRVDPETFVDPDAPQRGRYVHLVDPTLLAHESVLSIALGVLLVNDGSKGLVRWTQWHVPEPWFGVVHGPATDIVLRVGFGAATIACAWGVLQLRRWALPALLGLIVAMAASVALGWGQWDDWAARETAARAAWFGRDLDPARVQAMQSIVPELLVVWLAGLLAATLLAARRFVR